MPGGSDDSKPSVFGVSVLGAHSILTGAVSVPESSNVQRAAIVVRFMHQRFLVFAIALAAATLVMLGSHRLWQRMGSPAIALNEATGDLYEPSLPGLDPFLAGTDQGDLSSFVEELSVREAPTPEVHLTSLSALSHPTLQHRICRHDIAIWQELEHALSDSVSEADASALAAISVEGCIAPARAESCAWARSALEEHATERLQVAWQLLAHCNDDEALLWLDRNEAPLSAITQLMSSRDALHDLPLRQPARLDQAIETLDAQGAMAEILARYAAPTDLAHALESPSFDVDFTLRLHPELRPQALDILEACAQRADFVAEQCFLRLAALDRTRASRATVPPRLAQRFPESFARFPTRASVDDFLNSEGLPTHTRSHSPFVFPIDVLVARSVAFPVANFDSDGLAKTLLALLDAVGLTQAVVELDPQGAHLYNEGTAIDLLATTLQPVVATYAFERLAPHGLSASCATVWSDMPHVVCARPAALAHLASAGFFRTDVSSE